MKPYKFEPYLKSVIWGGEDIAPYKGIATDQHQVGESWEISGVAGHESIVAEGPDKGLSLPQLIDKYKGDLVGEQVYEKFGNTFPLLIKLIDAKGDLSVQVHPNDALAKIRHNSFGKTEMWYILRTAPGAKIYAGLAKQITKDDYSRMVKDNTIMQAVATHDSHAGDVFFLPAGRIHAIGAGNLLAEIQQTSDITYRVYDFGRIGADGKPRQLHVEEAKDAIDYHVYPTYKTDYDRTSAHAKLVTCPYFDVLRHEVSGTEEIDLGAKSFVVVMCLDRACTINGVSVHQGDTILVPACDNHLHIEGAATLLTAQL